MKFHALLLTAYFLQIHITQATTAEIGTSWQFPAGKIQLGAIILPQSGQGLACCRSRHPVVFRAEVITQSSPFKPAAKTFCKRCLEGLLSPGPSHLKGIFNNFYIIYLTDFSPASMLFSSLSLFLFLPTSPLIPSQTLTQLHSVHVNSCSLLRHCSLSGEWMRSDLGGLLF